MFSLTQAGSVILASVLTAIGVLVSSAITLFGNTQVASQNRIFQRRADIYGQALQLIQRTQGKRGDGKMYPEDEHEIGDVFSIVTLYCSKNTADKLSKLARHFSSDIPTEDKLKEKDNSVSLSLVSDTIEAMRLELKVATPRYSISEKLWGVIYSILGYIFIGVYTLVLILYIISIAGK